MNAPFRAPVGLPVLHEDQVRLFWRRRDPREYDLTISRKQRAAWRENAGGRFKALRCGRRYGKTTFGETWIGDGATQGLRCGWFAPNYKYIDEVYEDFRLMLDPVIGSSSKTKHVMRTRTGGLVDFWTLEDERAGRSRYYDRIFIDEGAYAPPHTINTWTQSIKPTLLDTGGACMVASNTKGNAEDNFLWQVCNNPALGFIEYHARSIDNPTVPRRLKDETDEEHWARRVAVFEELRRREDPLVFLQEYEAEFVDWSGVAFFSLEKLLVNGKPLDPPAKCDGVFAIIDTASKTGTENDGTAVGYWARNRSQPHKLVLLDWDIVQIEGSLLEHWLPGVFGRLEELAKLTGARGGVLGAWVEDASSGTILYQQAKRRELPLHAIDSKLTSLGKDERALNASGYVFRGEVKIATFAYEKTSTFKGATKNHLISQVTGFRMGDKDNAKRADDLLDVFTYGVALALGNKAAF